MFGAFTALFFLIGLAIGSFLNVVIFRIDDLKTILYTRSHCPSCQKVLKWHDMIPFLSFFLLQSKCRYCGAKISWQYPLVELSTGILFAFLYFMLGLGWGLIFYLLVFSILIVVFVYDLKTQTVPEFFVWPALILSALFGWYFGGFNLFSLILGGLIAGGFLAALVYFSGEKWMGAGDIKLGLIMGFLLGYPNVLFGLFLAFILGSFAGLIYVYVQNKQINRALLKQSLPFAPFLIISTLIGIVFASKAINWYLGVLN